MVTFSVNEQKKKNFFFLAHEIVNCFKIDKYMVSFFFFFEFFRFPIFVRNNVFLEIFSSFIFIEFSNVLALFNTVFCFAECLELSFERR